jgi:hypothetical protein
MAAGRLFDPIAAEGGLFRRTIFRDVIAERGFFVAEEKLPVDDHRMGSSATFIQASSPRRPRA